MIERTALSSIEEPIWASATAPTAESAEFLAKLESLERWSTLQWWHENPAFQITEDFIPYLPEDQKQIIDAVVFEWEPYQAQVKCVKILNPYKLEIVLAIIEASVNGKNWRFFGNGLDESLIKAAEKACLETLQFIPGLSSSLWDKLETSQNENDKRIFAWSASSKNYLFGNTSKFDLGYFGPVKCSETFFEKINRASKLIHLKSQIIDLQHSANIFVAYVVSASDWRKTLGVPLV